MVINKIVKYKKTLFTDYIFYFNTSIFYKIIKKYFNKDIWRIIIKFIYPNRKQLIIWKNEHILNSFIYINLFKYLYLTNLTSLNNITNKNIIDFYLKKDKSNCFKKDLYYLQYKFYQNNIKFNKYKFVNNIVKYKSITNI